MGSPPDKARRKQLRDDYRNAERAARSALMPLDRSQFAALVEFVDDHVVDAGCDHTTRHAESWARDHGVDWDGLADGLEEFGGYCDCEIVMNCHPEVVFGSP